MGTDFASACTVTCSTRKIIMIAKYLSGHV